MPDDDEQCLTTSVLHDSTSTLLANLALHMPAVAHGVMWFRHKT
jgi:hypothetical protein